MEEIYFCTSRVCHPPACSACQSACYLKRVAILPLMTLHFLCLRPLLSLSRRQHPSLIGSSYLQQHQHESQSANLGGLLPDTRHPTFDALPSRQQLELLERQKHSQPESWTASRTTSSTSILPEYPVHACANRVVVGAVGTKASLHSCQGRGSKCRGSRREKKGVEEDTEWTEE